MVIFHSCVTIDLGLFENGGIHGLPIISRSFWFHYWKHEVTKPLEFGIAFLGKPTWCILGGPHLMLNWPLWGRWKFNFGGFLKCTPNHPVIRPWLRIDETWLVVWNIFYFSHHIGNFIVPTDELIFFRGVGIPPTSMVFWILDFQKPPHQVWRALTCHDNVLHWELKLCTLAPQKKNITGAPLYDRNKTHDTLWHDQTYIYIYISEYMFHHCQIIIMNVNH